MNYYHKITSTLEATKDFYLTMIAEKKSLSSRKAYMTRIIKQHEDYLNDITSAVAYAKKKGIHYGWYHGEIFQSTHVRFYTREVEMLKQMRASII